MNFFLLMTDTNTPTNSDFSTWISLYGITEQQNMIRYKVWRDLYTRFCCILDEYFYNTLCEFAILDRNYFISNVTNIEKQ